MASIHKIHFKDGREYRIYCANKAQEKRFALSVKGLGAIAYEALNGIHDIAQWEKISKVIK